MSTELTTTGGPQPQSSPFGSRALSTSINAGSVAVEQERAIAEAQGQLILAKKFPRDMTKAHVDLMAACKSKAFAEKAFYAKPQGGSTVKGPSIRLAEEVARVYGNCQYGHRELGRDNKKSEVEVFFWDMENNNYNKRQITVMHVIDTREGPKPMRDQSQIDMKINNVASKQVRGLILAGVAKWLVEEAIAECVKTLAGNNDEPIEARLRKMTQAFAKFGVTPERLEQHLGHKLDQTTLDELVDLQGMFNSLRDGTPASELFPLEQEDPAADAPSPTGQKVAEAVKQGAAAKAGKPAAAPKAQAAAPAEQPSEQAEPAATQTSKKAHETSTKPIEEAPAAEQSPAPAQDRQAAGLEPEDGDTF